MKDIRKIIMLPHGANKQLAQRLGYSQNTVTSALKCQINTKKANHVRREALKMGGVVMEVKETVQL